MRKIVCDLVVSDVMKTCAFKSTRQSMHQSHVRFCGRNYTDLDCTF